MAARIVEVCDLAVDRIREGWGDPAPAAVERCYLYQVPDERSGLDSLAGRIVLVYPPPDEAYIDGGPVTRRRNDAGYRVVVTVIEPYTGTGRPPREWVDERVAWVEAEVYAKLGDNRTMIGGTLRCQENRASVLHDVVASEQMSAFWSECEFEFREHS